jgi:hypothetical protein
MGDVKEIREPIVNRQKPLCLLGDLKRFMIRWRRRVGW